jgi:hypothetical protein
MEKQMSKISKEEKAIQERSRTARFKANGEPKQAPGFDKKTLEPGDELTADREDLLNRDKFSGNVSNLSGAFDDVDAAVSSIKSADSGTRTQ